MDEAKKYDDTFSYVYVCKLAQNPFLSISQFNRISVIYRGIKWMGTIYEHNKDLQKEEKRPWRETRPHAQLPKSIVKQITASEQWEL
jgi:hypothetical protein